MPADDVPLFFDPRWLRGDTEKYLRSSRHEHLATAGRLAAARLEIERLMLENREFRREMEIYRSASALYFGGAR